MGSGPRVSVVVTGYRRVPELRETIESLRAVSDFRDFELILADDGSPPEQRQEMRKLPFDKWVLAERNRGLAANTNAGLEAAEGDYVLQLQDDWRCLGPRDFLAQGLRLLESRPDVGLVRFTSLGLPRPDETLSLEGGVVAHVFRPVPGSGAFLYSDQPHLKSRAFVEFIGAYEPSRYMQRTELDMRDRFNAQTRFSAAFLEGYEVFEHIGEAVSHRRPLPVERVGRFMKATPGLRQLLRRWQRWRHGRGDGA